MCVLLLDGQWSSSYEEIEFPCLVEMNRILTLAQTRLDSANEGDLKTQPGLNAIMTGTEATQISRTWSKWKYRIPGFKIHLYFDMGWYVCIY